MKRQSNDGVRRNCKSILNRRFLYVFVIKEKKCCAGGGAGTTLLGRVVLDTEVTLSESVSNQSKLFKTISRLSRASPKSIRVLSL